MADQVSDSAPGRFAPTVIEPDPELRAELQALASIGDSVDPIDDAVPLTLLGPGAPLSHLESSLDEGHAVVVLAAAGQSGRLGRALDDGCDDAMVWPGDAGELRARLAAAARREQTRHALKVETGDLTALLGLSELLSSTRDIEGSLRHIAKRMAEVMRSERCSIIILDDEATQGVVVADSADETLRNQPIAVADRYPEIVEVVRTRAPLVIDDVGKDPLFDDVREIIQDKPVGNTTLFPVKVNRRVQGVLLIRGADVRRTGLTPRQIRFGTIVANATEIALRNARMYQSFRQRTERALSARVRASRRLRQLEKYQRFFDLAGDGLVIVDGRGAILFANEAAQEILGFEAEAITQIRLQDVADAEGTELVEELIAGLRRGRQRRRVDLPIVRASGEPAILALSSASLDPSSPKKLPPGATPDRWSQVTAIISLRDVTETRRIQDELKKTKDFLENVIQSSADAIVAADISGTILIFNAGAEAITGYERDEVIGKMNVEKLYPAGVAREIMRRLRSPRFGGVGRYESGMHELLGNDGTPIPIGLAAALIEDEGKAIATVGIFQDLRERIRMEEELARAQRQLELSERQAAVVELAGTAAHELSQPLTTILGSAELMARKLPKDVPGHEALKRMVSECERMAEILKKIGRIAKYETKPYLGYTNILDLDAASKNEDQS